MIKDYYNYTFSSFLKESELRTSVDQHFDNFDLLDAAVFWLTNNERRNHNLKPLKFHSKLREMAILHSNQMRLHNFFSHENPVETRYQNLEDRLDSVRGSNFEGFKTVGENIAMIPTLKGTKAFTVRVKNGTPHIYGSDGVEKVPCDCLEYAKEVVTGWMNSPGHRANILRADYKYLGCGCASALKDHGYVSVLYFYFTQNFGTDEITRLGHSIVMLSDLNFLKTKKYKIPLFLGQYIWGCQIDGYLSKNDEKVGVVIEKNGKLGIKNLSGFIWTVTLNDGSIKQVAPGYGMPIQKGLIITYGISKQKAEII